MNCSNTCTIVMSASSSINIVTDIVIPLLSALLGGILALAGVYVTLNADKSIREREREENARPFFSIFALYDHGRFTDAKAHTFSYVSGNDYDDNQSHLVINLVNSEKIEFIIDGFNIDNLDYHPYKYCKEFISKGLVCTIVVNVKKDADLSNAFMCVTDSNYHQHTYKLTCQNELVIDCVEVKKEV